MHTLSGTFTIREASEPDAPRLRELLRASTTAGGVRWSVEPAADAFAALRAERNGWCAALAENPRGDVVGFVSVATRTVIRDGEPRRTCYVTNLKVLPPFRRLGIGDALCWRAIELCRRAGGDSVPILMLIAAGNDSMRRRETGPRGLPHLVKIANVVVYSIPTRRAAVIGPVDGIEVRRACPDDIEEMAALAARVACERQFAPGFDAQSLSRWIASVPGLELSDHLVARSRNRLQGWVGWWDELSVRSVRIAGYTRAGAVRRLFQVAGARLAGVHPPSGVGDRVGSLRAIATCVPFERPDVLRALVAETARLRVHDCSWLKVAFDAREPAGGALRDLRAHVAAYDARVTSPSGRCMTSDDRPVHLEAALI